MADPGAFARTALKIEELESNTIDPLLDRLIADVLPVDNATNQRQRLGTVTDARGPHALSRWVYESGLIDVTDTLATAEKRPYDVRLLLGVAATEATSLTRASLTIVRYQDNRMRHPLSGLHQLDSTIQHTIAVYDTSIEPPRLHAAYHSVPLEVHYPDAFSLEDLMASVGIVHVDELALARRANEFSQIQAEQAARLSWLQLLDR